MKSHPGNGATERPLLSVVDDDEMLRESLPELLREFGFPVKHPTILPVAGSRVNNRASMPRA